MTRHGQCPKCRGQLSLEATRCKHCGYEASLSIERGTIVTGLIIIGGITGFIAVASVIPLLWPDPSYVGIYATASVQRFVVTVTATIVIGWLIYRQLSRT